MDDLFIYYYRSDLFTTADVLKRSRTVGVKCKAPVVIGKTSVGSLPKGVFRSHKLLTATETERKEEGMNPLNFESGIEETNQQGGVEKMAVAKQVLQ